MKLALTGHRPDKLYGYNLYNEKYIKLARKISLYIMDNNFDYFISGMALGADTLFAMIVLKFKLTHDNFILECAIPCLNHSSKWNDQDKKRYNEILGKADHVVCTLASEYTPGCMQKRNEYMVDQCDSLLAIWDGSSGGTKNCIDYARKTNKPIYIINPKEE